MQKLFVTLAVLVALAAPAHAGEPKVKVDTSDLNPIELYVFMLAMKAAPPGKAWAPPAGPHSKETPQQRAERYKRIARDIYKVAFHEKQKPIPGYNRLGTAGFMLAMAVGESSLAPDADLGPCYMKGKYRSRCDGGLAVGILQVQMAKGEQKYYWRNRKRLLWRGLKGLRGSFGTCHKNPPDERLAAYASGTCASKAGRKASRRRMKLIRAVMGYAQPPKGDMKKYVIKAKKPKEKGGSGGEKVAASD